MGTPLVVVELCNIEVCKRAHKTNQYRHKCPMARSGGIVAAGDLTAILPRWTVCHPHFDNLIERIMTRINAIIDQSDLYPCLVNLDAIAHPASNVLSCFDPSMTKKVSVAVFAIALAGFTHARF